MVKATRKTARQTVNDWYTRASEELGDKSVEDIHWQTPEGIEVKPVYTADDLEGIAHLDSMPGFPPFTRGPKATMYCGRSWTVRQYAGVSTAEESNAFYRANLKGGANRIIRRF